MKTPGLPSYGQKIYYKTKSGDIIKGVVVDFYKDNYGESLLLKLESGEKRAVVIKNNVPLKRRKW